MVETETACIGNDELEQFAIKSILVGWIQDGLMMLGGLMIDGYIVEVGNQKKKSIVERALS